jgi:hypothetical protein
MQVKTGFVFIVLLFLCFILFCHENEAGGVRKKEIKLKEHNNGYCLYFHKELALRITMKPLKGSKIEIHEWCMALKTLGYPRLVSVLTNYKPVEQKDLVSDWENFTKNGMFELIRVEAINDWKIGKIEEIPECLKKKVFKGLSIEDIRSTKSQLFVKDALRLIFVDLIYSTHAYRIAKEEKGKESLEVLLNSPTDLKLVSYNDKSPDNFGQYNINYEGHLDRKLTLEESYACSYGKPQVVLSPCE